jgi:DMSO/TMAO reductase YedYZ molybdopterin-dependent catalytic subunit
MKTATGLMGLMILSASLTAPATRGSDEPPRATGAVLLRVEGEVPHPFKLTADEFARLPRQSVRARDRDGKEAEYEGVPLHEIVERSGLKLGQDLRGTALALYLLVQAADGYRAVFALPEIDPACTDRTILLVDRRDGQPLSPTEGPLRIIVPGEKRHARWVRQVVVLKIGRA